MYPSDRLVMTIPALFKCERCHYETIYLSTLKKHLSRKKPCQPLYCTRSCEELLSDYTRVNKHTGAYKCTFCDKVFGTRQGKYNHQQVCIVKQELQDNICQGLVDKIKESVIQSMKDRPVTIINNNTTINNTANNTIHINAFGKENLDHIPKSFLDQCVKRRDKGLLELVQKIHFDERVKENHNLKITNKKMPFIHMHNGNKWMLEKKDKVLNQVIDKSHGMMQNHFEDYEDEYKETRYLSENMLNYVREWLEKVSDKDRQVYDSLLTDVYLLIYNATN